MSTVAARLERFAATPAATRFMMLVGLGIWFETYDIFVVGFLGTALVQQGFLLKEQLGTFVAVGFLGMFVGTTVFGRISDRIGRRPAFVYMLAAFSVFTLLAALAPSARWLMLARFMAGVGIGGETVIIDSYVTEMMPSHVRGRMVALTQVVGFTSVPVAAYLARVLVPQPNGWRYVLAIGSIGASLVWVTRRRLPESPRWLEAHGRLEEAHAVLNQLVPDDGPLEPTPVTPTPSTSLAGRTAMLSVFNALQTLGFYGFASWYPHYMTERGIALVDALQYSWIIALTAPLGALVGLVTSDRIERKWTLVVLSVLVAGVGLLFGHARTGSEFIACGIGLTILNYWFSSVFHSWQCELFPTRVRTSAVGLAYGVSRLSAAASSWLIGYVLASQGVNGVFTFVAGAMVLVAIDVALFSPTVNGRRLEDVSTT